MGAREQFDDEQLERLQLRLQVLERKFAAIPFSDGVRVTKQDLLTTPTTIAHQLGRTPIGVIALKLTEDAALGFSTTQPSDPTKFVNLESSVACTADLWFF